jgi:hypothetical protein
LVRTEPEFYDVLYNCFPQIDAQRRYWVDFDEDKFIDSFASRGWAGVSEFINAYMIGPTKTQRARAFAAEFRKKHIADPYSYPLNYLIRSLFLSELSETISVSPVGPKTRAHTVRKVEELNS